MGCFKKFLNMLILSFAVIGFVSVGGLEWVSQNVSNYFDGKNPLENNSTLGDFSKLDSEFEIDKSMNFFGYKGILAEHNASGQKFIILDTKEQLLTEDDIKSDDLEEKMMRLIKKQRAKSITPSEFKITSRGKIKAYGTTVPCARFTAKVRKLPMGSLNGMVAVVETEGENNKILISANQSDKYSQLITKQFFGQISK